jgi:butyrate kinase
MAAATEFRILTINPGSTSTKIGIFVDDRVQQTWTLRHSDDEMAKFKGRPIIEQEDFRRALIERELTAHGVPLASFHAVVGRGGLLRPLVSGTYRVDDVMLEELRLAPRGEHASNLGAILAHGLAQSIGVSAYVVDPVSVNERSARARLSGTALLERDGFCHALNSKATAKRYAREQGRAYADLRLVVAHLGGGVCISAHQCGKMVDVTDADQEGPFSPERSGTVPTTALVRLCFSGKYTQKEIARMLVGEGGLYSYLGTKDLVEAQKRAASGDAKAALVLGAMAYQIAKDIGAMAAVLEGRVDAVLLTGGMAHSKSLVDAVSVAVGWIAPVVVYPGEEELQALAEGGLRVLRGEEPAMEFPES